MKVSETCSCGSSIAVEDRDDALNVVKDWREFHRCLPRPWRKDPAGSTGASTQIGFRPTRTEVKA